MMKCEICDAELNHGAICTLCEAKHKNWHPGFMTRVCGFIVAKSQWMLAGCPRRDPDEVHDIFHEHCKPCWWYSPTLQVPGRRGGCRRCGCHVSDDVDDFGNKINNPLASCPLKRPKWLNIVEADEGSSNTNQPQE